MKDEILISVIMPVYNGEKYVGDAIDSILKQSFSNFEFIIVNDASMDQTDTVIKSYVDRRITYCCNLKHKGNYKCRNQAARLAKGKYLAMMDADDIAVRTRLEKQITYLETNPGVLAVGSDRILIPKNVYGLYPHTYREILLSLLKNNAFVHSSLVVRSSVFMKLNGYDEKYYYSSDYDLVCRLALLGEVINLPEALVYYRCYSGQISQQYQKEQAMYAAKIRQQYQRCFINHFKGTEQTNVSFSEVASSAMGEVIAYYTYANYLNDNDIEQIAEKSLDLIVSSLSPLYPMKLENGILGIACGLIYLLRNNILEGEEDEILSEIDSFLFRHIACLDGKDNIDWYGWLYYLRLRISYEKKNRELSLVLCLQNTIHLLRCLLTYGDLNDSIISEIKWFHKKKICPEVTSKLLGEKEQQIVVEPLLVNRIAFLIPVRIESKERERNLDMLLEMLSQIERAEIWILEADSHPCYKMKKSYSNVYYLFVKDQDPIFYRTKYLNHLLNTVDCTIAGIWDTDVILEWWQIQDAITAVEFGKAVMSFPYNGRFLMFPQNISDLFCLTRSMDLLREYSENQINTRIPYSFGGAVFINREKYLQAGGENEYFYGWGAEDLERVKRMEILGFPIYRSEGPLFHLFHPRKRNSWYGSDELELKSRKEFLKICGMTRKELQQYIKTWQWINEEKRD